MSRMTWAEVDSLIESSMNAYGDSAVRAKAHNLLRKEWTQLTLQADERDGLREMLLSQAGRLAQAEVDAKMLDTVRRRASSVELTLAEALRQLDQARATLAKVREWADRGNPFDGAAGDGWRSAMGKVRAILDADPAPAATHEHDALIDVLMQTIEQIDAWSQSSPISADIQTAVQRSAYSAARADVAEILKGRLAEVNVTINLHAQSVDPRPEHSSGPPQECAYCQASAAEAVDAAQAMSKAGTVTAAEATESLGNINAALEAAPTKEES